LAQLRRNVGKDEDMVPPDSTSRNDDRRLSLGRHGAIGLDELEFSFTRSGGPGGQNVNKVATRATLRFDVSGSPSLTAEQRTTILGKLAGRIDSVGVLRVVSSRHRTQLQNRRAAEDRLVELLIEALHRDPTRHKTRVPKAVKRKRLEAKAHRGLIKQRRKVREDE
jgi:ribosome-associated protein